MEINYAAYNLLKNGQQYLFDQINIFPIFSSGWNKRDIKKSKNLIWICKIKSGILSNSNLIILTYCIIVLDLHESEEWKKNSPVSKRSKENIFPQWFKNFWMSEMSQKCVLIKRYTDTE